MLLGVACGLSLFCVLSLETEDDVLDDICVCNAVLSWITIIWRSLVKCVCSSAAPVGFGVGHRRISSSCLLFLFEPVPVELAT